MWKRYLIYHIRWQISAWVMMPVMLFLERQGLPLWKNLIIGQAFGACVFWFVDKWIFSTKTDVNDMLHDVEYTITEEI